MENDSMTKAPKDKCCPYCGQAFTSSSLGRHLDLYIKEKNPKAPDGVHNVDEIRKLRDNITRRQPRRGGTKRDSSAQRNSRAGSKRSSRASDADSIMTRSPGTPTESSSWTTLPRSLTFGCEHPDMVAAGIVNGLQTGDGDTGTDTRRSRSNSQRVVNKQMMKSSLEVKQRVQDAVDTAKAAELALREMMSSWKTARQHIETQPMPFDFSPLSMDFPALCLQCLEAPPTLYSSTPHSTATSWSITPPGDKQNEALKFYFQAEFRKWKTLCTAATSASVDDLISLTSRAATQHENASYTAQKAVESAEELEAQVAEHLEESFRVWDQLSIHRRQELWVLEMARNIGKRQKEVSKLKEVRYSLKQKNTSLEAQIDHLNRQQLSKEFKIMPSTMLKADEKLLELWGEAGISGRHGSPEVDNKDRQDLNTIVSGAIERWKNIIVTSRAANAMNAQRSLDQVSASLKTPTSATKPLSPEEPRLTLSRHSYKAGHPKLHPQSSMHAQTGTDWTASINTAGPIGTTGGEPTATAASTPAQSVYDSDEDADADDDEDADVDMEMEGGTEYLAVADTPSRHAAPPELSLHCGPQPHQMSHVINSQVHNQHMPAVRHSPYQQRNSPYGHHGVLSSHQMHMSPQAFGHQLQTLEHHLAQGHSMEINRNNNNIGNSN